MPDTVTMPGAKPMVRSISQAVAAAPEPLGMSPPDEAATGGGAMVSAGAVNSTNGASSAGGAV